MNDTMLGRVFALSNDEEQAAFLNEAGRALKLLCKGEPAGYDMQLFRISDKLDMSGREFVRRLFENLGGVS